MSIWDLIIDDAEHEAYEIRTLPDFGTVIYGNLSCESGCEEFSLPFGSVGDWFIYLCGEDEFKAGVIFQNIRRGTYTLHKEKFSPPNDYIKDKVKRILGDELKMIGKETSQLCEQYLNDKQETYMSHFDELKSLHMDVAKTEFQTQVGKVILSNAKKMLKKQITNPFLSGFVNSAYFGIVAMSIAKYVVSMTGQSNKHVDWAIEAGMRAAYAEVGEKLNPSEFVAKLMKNVPEEETD